MVWYCVVRCGVVLCDVVGLVWYGIVWYGMARPCRAVLCYAMVLPEVLCRVSKFNLLLRPFHSIYNKILERTEFCRSKSHIFNSTQIKQLLTKARAVTHELLR